MLDCIRFQDFSIESEVGAAHHHISGVPGFDDLREMAFDALSLEMRHRVLNREHAPFGCASAPIRVDDLAGEPADRYGTDFWIIAEGTCAQSHFAALNLFYQPEAFRSRLTGLWEQQSQLGTSAAMVVQTHQSILITAEARYIQSYASLGVDAFVGNALFVGPTLVDVAVKSIESGR